MHNNLIAIRLNFNTCLRIFFSAGNKRFYCSICFLFSFYFLLFEIVLYQPHHLLRRYNNVQFIKSIERRFFITLIYSQTSSLFKQTWNIIVAYTISNFLPIKILLQI
jgi:hypothetical protein